MTVELIAILIVTCGIAAVFLYWAWVSFLHEYDAALKRMILIISVPLGGAFLSSLITGYLATNNGIHVLRDGWLTTFFNGVIAGFPRAFLGFVILFMVMLLVVKLMKWSQVRQEHALQELEAHLDSFSPILCHRCKYQGRIDYIKVKVSSGRSGIVAGFGEDGLEPMGFIASGAQYKDKLGCPKCGSPDHWETIR